METGNPIQVVIVEDDRAVREGLGMIINGTPGFRCLSTYRSVEDALRSMSGASPDVMLLDIHLPGMLGSDGVRAFREKHPELQILMLTIYDGQDKVFESICNGACGYLLKKTPPAKLLEAIREAYEGGAPVSPEIARKVVPSVNSISALIPCVTISAASTRSFTSTLNPRPSAKPSEAV